MNTITSRIEQLNFETKESLLKFLKIRSFFKPHGVYENKCCANGIYHIYKSHQPHFDKLAFNRVSKHDNGEVLFDIYNVELNDWVFLGIDKPIDPNVQLCQKIKDFFKPGRIYRNTKAHPGNYFTFSGCKIAKLGSKEHEFNVIACKRYDLMGKCDDLFLKVKSIKFEDWADIGDIGSLNVGANKHCVPPHCRVSETSSKCPLDGSYDVLVFVSKNPTPNNRVDVCKLFQSIHYASSANIANFFHPGCSYRHRRHGILKFKTRLPHASVGVLRFTNESGDVIDFNATEINFYDWNSMADEITARNKEIKNFFKPGQFYYCRLPEFDGMYFSFDAIQPDSNALIGMIYDFAGDHKLCEFSMDKININDWTVKSIY